MQQSRLQKRCKGYRESMELVACTKPPEQTVKPALSARWVSMSTEGHCGRRSTQDGQAERKRIEKQGEGGVVGEESAKGGLRGLARPSGVDHFALVRAWAASVSARPAPVTAQAGGRASKCSGDELASAHAEHSL
jgi:hypothetical protein